MHEYQDTYFLNAKEALKVASEQNRFGLENEFLQVCYYDGDKIESTLVNLIHLPMDNLLKTLSSGRLRIPEKIDFTGLELSSIVKVDVTTNFQMALYDVREARIGYNQTYFNILLDNTLDFTQNLRFYLPANSTTQVMQHVSRNIADVLEDMGFEVMFDLYYGIEDLESLKHLSEFNPHATININHLNNSYINKDCFNFVWFQDPMPSLSDGSRMELRERDILFSLLESIDNLILKKGVKKENILRQSIRTSTHLYNTNYDVKREKKIVFIGASYNKYIEYQDLMDDMRDTLKHGVIDIQALSEHYSIDEGMISNHLYPALLRQEIVLYTCKYSEIRVEVYGPGWDEFEEILPFYKGPLSYGEEVARVYNSAEYALVPNGYYQQRLFEMASCGTIPIVYSSVLEKKPFKYEESCLVFKRLEELDTITQQKMKVNLNIIQRDASYSDMVETIVKTIQKMVDNE